MKIVAIGGGDIGISQEYPYNLEKIDEEIVKLTNKTHPTLLFIGFNERANYFFGILKKNYMKLGAICNYLNFTEFENSKTVESKFKRADIIFLNGGNTISYVKAIKKYGLDIKLREALDRNVVLCGISAGAIIYHKFGSSDSRKYKNCEYKYTLARGLGFVDALFCPHYSNSDRPKDIERMMKNLKQVAICADNGTAIEIVDDDYKVIKSIENANFFKCYYKTGNFYSEKLIESGKLIDLLKKD